MLRGQVANEEVLSELVSHRHAAVGGHGYGGWRHGHGLEVAQAVVLLQDAEAELLEEVALVRCEDLIAAHLRAIARPSHSCITLLCRERRAFQCHYGLLTL